MVTKKNVFVMVLIFLFVAGIISAGAVGRGGFGAGMVLAASATDDATSRPIQRWQSLDAQVLEDCPICGDDVDPATIRSMIAQRAAVRAKAQVAMPTTMMGRQGRAVAPAASYGPSRAFSPARVAAPVASYGPNRAPLQGMSVNNRSGMRGAQPAAGASYGPAWAR